MDKIKECYWLLLETCPAGFQKKESGGYFFCYKHGTVTYQQAKQTCESNGLGLVEIDSNPKAAALDSIASYDYAWLGLVCPSRTNECNRNLNLWQWDRSQKALTTTSGYESRFYLVSGSIYGGGSGEYCAHWWKSPGIWGPQECHHGHLYHTLCEKGTLTVETMNVLRFGTIYFEILIFK